jgi:hypothetical protein
LLAAVHVEWNSLGSCVCMSSRLYTIIICGLILKGIEILKTEPVLIVVRFSLVCAILRILSDSYQIVIRLLSDCYQIVIRLLSDCYQIVIRLLSDYYQDVIRIFSDYYQDILSISSVVFTLNPQWCSQLVFSCVIYF